MNTRTVLICFALAILPIVAVVLGCTGPKQVASRVPVVKTWATVPDGAFTHPPERPHDSDALYFKFDQLDHLYRVPGEFTHRLNGDQYGFNALSFIITETHPGGGPGLHVHDIEEAHVLLEGTAQYRVGDRTFIVHAPYIAKVPAGVPHTFINAGVTPFNLIAVFPSKHPNTTRIGPNPLVPAGREREESPSGVAPR